MIFTITDKRRCGHAISGQMEPDTKRVLLDQNYLVAVVGTMIREMIKASSQDCPSCIKTEVIKDAQ